MGKQRPVRLTFYFRQGCHLCDDMWEQLQTMRADRSFELTPVDVDEEPALRERFGDKVPVLTAGDVELCHYYLDPRSVEAWLDTERD